MFSTTAPVVWIAGCTRENPYRCSRLSPAENTTRAVRSPSIKDVCYAIPAVRHELACIAQETYA